MTLSKGAATARGEKSLFNERCWDIHVQKNKVGPSPHITYKNQLQLDQRRKQKG